MRLTGRASLLPAAALFVCAGLVVGAAAGWQWWSRVHQIAVNQAALARRLDAAWTATGATPAGAGTTTGTTTGAARLAPAAADGAPVARLRLPRLRLTLVVVEGVADPDLLRGPGHVPGTARLGEPGNAGVAGHRYPGVFWDLDRLRAGDAVVVETAERWFVYRVFRSFVVGPADTTVLDARPAGAPPGTDRFLTLVTCEPKLTTARRLIRQAALVRVLPRAGGPPAELDG